jgi:hypothetical protein
MLLSKIKVLFAACPQTSSYRNTLIEKYGEIDLSKILFLIMHVPNPMNPIVPNANIPEFPYNKVF